MMPKRIARLIPKTRELKATLPTLLDILVY